MQDEYGLTLKEGEADMYKHSTNRDVRYAERELRHWRCVLFYLLIFATRNYPTILFPTLKNEALVLPEYNRVNIITLN